MLKPDPLLSLLGVGETLDLKPFMRRCTGCDELRDISLFPKHKLGKYGLDPRCRHCHTEKIRIYRRKLKERALT